MRKSEQNISGLRDVGKWFWRDKSARTSGTFRSSLRLLSLTNQARRCRALGEKLAQG